ncbi:unnamed protein product [Danaus chrysippus]|uniref:(African queen) hypothetical protein n=1 Tax=Danaus chrysippus TaxID=151541 RepID=A0A8J2QBF1_9NEOP|nr:unnamed protein product [Danaus chrysippus]
MPPPDKKTLKEETILQTYLNSFEQENEATATIAVAGDVEEESDTGVTYFVDEEGRYYYQPAGDNQSIVSLSTEVTQDNDVEITEDTQMLVDADSYQTVTLVPSETGNGEVSYVLVMQEENKPVVNLNIKVDQEEKGADVYNFEDEEEAAEEVSEDGEDAPKTKTTKRNKYVSPYFTCSFCSYTSHRRYLLLRHMKSHSEERPHKCSVCERGFKTIASLQNHVNMHNGVKPHVCKYCKSPFTTSGELVRHVRYRHTHEKPHKCSECDYASVELSKLRRHVRCHTGERPYQWLRNQCLPVSSVRPDAGGKQIYAYTFKNYTRLINRLNASVATHEGEKCFKCELCPYASTTLRHLKTHMLKHTDEKPFACEQCDHSFRQKQLLRRHQNLYHNPHYEPKPPKEKTHTCHECKRTFAHKGNLIRHLAIHDPESGHHERALALKIGRQRKIKANTGGPSKAVDSDDDMMKLGLNKEIKRGELVTVADGNGQQYVVLEVIQLEDGTEQQVAVVAPEFMEEEQEEEEEEEEPPIETPKPKILNRTIKLEKEVDTCFGFDEDEEEEETEEDITYSDKVVLRLV